MSKFFIIKPILKTTIKKSIFKTIIKKPIFKTTIVKPISKTNYVLKFTTFTYTFSVNINNFIIITSKAKEFNNNSTLNLFNTFIIFKKGLIL